MNLKQKLTLACENLLIGDLKHAKIKKNSSTERQWFYRKCCVSKTSTFKNFFGITRNSLNVLDFDKLKKTLRDINPDIVINATGKVAGIQGNIEHPTELMIANSETIISITKACHELRIGQLFQFASACVYPLNESSSSSPEDIGTGILVALCSNFN